MKLGLQLGYWGAQPPDNHAELVAAAEDAGFDAVFTAEAWGSDAYTPLAWWGRRRSGCGWARRWCSCPRAPRPRARWRR